MFNVSWALIFSGEVFWSFVWFSWFLACSNSASALAESIFFPISALFTKTVTSLDSTSAKPPVKAIEFQLPFFKTLNTPKKIAVYDYFDSSAIESNHTTDNDVKIKYTSNTSKAYGFNCTSISEFTDRLSSLLIDLETNRNPVSVGKFVAKEIKEGRLVAQ